MERETSRRAIAAGPGKNKTCPQRSLKTRRSAQLPKGVAGQIRFSRRSGNSLYRQISMRLIVNRPAVTSELTLCAEKPAYIERDGGASRP